MIRAHNMPFGASVHPQGGVRFRLWAPSARNVELCLDTSGSERRIPMIADSQGWCELDLPDARPGMRYSYLIDGEVRAPDPASRFQPDDVHGSSEIVDPASFDWHDGAWNGRPWHESVLYELHVGAFTQAGTFSGVIDRLDHLAELGVTAVELMPVADWPGLRNWGYDGAYPYAPDSRYGRPEDLKRLVQEAHARGLMVFLDVVYNHFGPEGNYLHRYAASFFTERYHTPWGPAINFDGQDGPTVRDFFIHNALYWIEEFHFDGLRLDAVHAIHDRSDPDILTEIARAVRTELPGNRHVHLVLENDLNEACYLERDGDGTARLYAAQWNDDFHHAAHVLLTGEDSGYYADYSDDPLGHLARTLTEGFAYQGQRSHFRSGTPRGEPSAHLPPLAFITFLQNHDQIGNRAFGERITGIAPENLVRAAMALVLLAPSPPLIFMGEEWASSATFSFFCDFENELAKSVREGRRREFARFPEFADESARRRIPDPNDPTTFKAAQLDWGERLKSPHDARLDLCRRLLAIRQGEIVPRLPKLRRECGSDRLGERALYVWWSLADGCTLKVYLNFGVGQTETADVPAVGRCLFASGESVEQEVRRGVLPEHSAAFFLESAAD